MDIGFPSIENGKSRDFFMRLELGNNISVSNLSFPQGTSFENSDGEMPNIEDGMTTLLYFSETKQNVFLVKGETLMAIS